MASRGRPSAYTKELAEKVCEGISQGKSIRTICQDEDLPAPAAIYRWLIEHEDFRDQYAHAREHRAHARFERIDEVLADMRAGTIDSQQARVEIDAIKWQCGKEHGKYNDKQVHEHTGAGGGAVKFVIEG